MTIKDVAAHLNVSEGRITLGLAVLSPVKTGKAFYRPMNHVVHAHLKCLAPENPQPDQPVFLGGGSRPNARFQELCEFAGIKPKRNVETGQDEPWMLKDLRKTCATYYDEHIPESSIEILGHSVGESRIATMHTALRWHSRRS